MTYVEMPMLSFRDFPLLFKVLMVIGKYSQDCRGIYNLDIFNKFPDIESEYIADAVNVLVDIKLVTGGYDVRNGKKMAVFWITYDNVEFVNKLVDMFYVEELDGHSD